MTIPLPNLKVEIPMTHRWYTSHMASVGIDTYIVSTEHGGCINIMVTGKLTRTESIHTFHPIGDDYS